MNFDVWFVSERLLGAMRPLRTSGMCGQAGSAEADG